MKILIPALAAVTISSATRESTTAPAPSELRGITFTVDTTTAGDLVQDVLAQLGLRVTYAGGRGRIDVLARAARPGVRMKGIVLAPTSAAPGDYYLFDSVSLVHVHPRSKTFTTYRLADVSSNYENRRDNWPFFAYDSAQPVAMRDARTTDGTRSPFTVFWHAELMSDTSCNGPAYGRCLVRDLARGRSDVLAAPAQELGVAQWVGVTMALAAISGLDSLSGAPVHLTTVGYWKDGDGVVHLVKGRFLTGLRRVSVDPSVLQLPPGFTGRRIRAPSSRPR